MLSTEENDVVDAEEKENDVVDEEEICSGVAFTGLGTGEKISLPFNSCEVIITLLNFINVRNFSPTSASL